MSVMPISGPISDPGAAAAGPVSLVELLDSCRLVTLTGPGGTGKTRLAIEVADGCIGAFADGVHFVPLASISDADLVLPTVAARLGLREAPARHRFA